MTDAPPQLGSIPQQSEFSVPTLSSGTTTNSTHTNNTNMSATNGNASLQNTKDAVYNNTSAAMNSVANHPVTQNVKDTVSNGPVAENIKEQHAKTTSEFRSLADSRTTPSSAAATGQPLTHYHSFFYNLLSWENPRATSIAFAVTVLSIFAGRYLPALRWSFKVLYMVLGVTASAEVVGKLALSRGLASSFRPKRYYTIPREALESSLEDVEQLLNFFVIEFQRILFAENVVHTVVAFFTALISYWLIKFLPLWGLSLMGVSTIFLAPLIYKNNKELIDSQLAHASNVVNAQASQVRDMAGHHTARATESIKGYTNDYTTKAQEMIGSARGRSSSPVVSTKPAPSTSIKTEKEFGGSSYKASDFPHAPKQEPTPGVVPIHEQYERSQFGGEAMTS